MRLPVRTTLLQNRRWRFQVAAPVRLPVRTTLLQNTTLCIDGSTKCDYQSERHCSKTRPWNRRCARLCDYQSERHCSKTQGSSRSSNACAITSQNDTAPKQSMRLNGIDAVRLPVRTTLLQNVPAPLRVRLHVRLPVRTTLLQN